jgi:hypothetical protein
MCVCVCVGAHARQFVSSGDKQINDEKKTVEINTEGNQRHRNN